MSRRIWGSHLILLLLVSTGSAVAQKIDKPFYEWSKETSQKVLTDSAWAKTYQSGTAAADAANSAREQADNVYAGGQRGSSARSAGLPPVVIRLHSGLPVRQAITRLNQIDSGYDKMNEQQRAVFDANAKKFLDCAICQNYYVVTLTQFPGKVGDGVEEGIFQTMTNEDMTGNVWLQNDKGEKRMLAQFTPPKGRGDSAVFFFPRKDENGKLLITPDSKELRFVFNNDFLTSGKNRYSRLIPRWFDFRVSKLLIGEDIAF